VRREPLHKRRDEARVADRLLLEDWKVAEPLVHPHQKAEDVHVDLAARARHQGLPQVDGLAAAHAVHLDCHLARRVGRQQVLREAQATLAQRGAASHEQRVHSLEEPCADQHERVRVCQLNRREKTGGSQRI